MVQFSVKSEANRVMKTKSGTWLLALVALAISNAAAAQDLKIGVVNVSKLVSESPQAQQARSSMAQQFTERKKELKQQRQQLQEDVQRLKRDGSAMSEETRQQLEDSVRDQQRQLKLKQSEYKDDVKSAEKEELGKMREQIGQVVQQYAQDHNYDLIVGQGVLYASDQVDVTPRVLQRLKAGD